MQSDRGGFNMSFIFFFLKTKAHIFKTTNADYSFVAMHVKLKTYKPIFLLIMLQHSFLHRYNCVCVRVSILAVRFD